MKLRRRFHSSGAEGSPCAWLLPGVASEHIASAFDLEPGLFVIVQHQVVKSAVAFDGAAFPNFEVHVYRVLGPVPKSGTGHSKVVRLVNSHEKARAIIGPVG